MTKNPGTSGGFLEGAAPSLVKVHPKHSFLGPCGEVPGLGEHLAPVSTPWLHAGRGALPARSWGPPRGNLSEKELNSGCHQPLCRVLASLTVLMAMSENPGPGCLVTGLHRAGDHTGGLNHAWQSHLPTAECQDAGELLHTKLLSLTFALQQATLWSAIHEMLGLHPA